MSGKNMSKCVQCGAEFLGGEAPHEMKVTENGKTRIDLYCIECIDYVSWAMWNDEEWGPYPSRLQHRGAEGGKLN
jgi:hypothetical protein